MWLLSGMPPGHPFQGDEPKHLEEENKKLKDNTKDSSPRLPRRPFLSKSNFDSTMSLFKPDPDDKVKTSRIGSDRSAFDSSKMMAYDDFTNEDVGNIIMDAPENRKLEPDHEIILD